jgi:WD40 repeat protein
LQGGECKKLGRSAPRQLSGIQLSPEGNYCAFATTAGTIYFRKLSDGTNYPAQVRSLNTVTRYRFADKGRRLISASLDGTIRAVAVPGTRPFPDYAFDCGHCDQLTPWGYRYTRDGKTVAIESPNGVRVSHRTQPQETIAILGEAGTTPIVFTPDGKHLLTHSKTAITIWDWRTAKAIAKLPPEPSPFLHGMLNRPGTRYGLLREDLTLEMFAIPSGERLFGPVTARRKGGVLINPRGDRISIIAFNNYIQTWDVATQKSFPEVDVKRDAIFYDNEFSPSTGRLATASTDLLVRQWNDNVQLPQGPTLALDAPPEYLGYSNDGRRLLVVDFAGVLHLFNAASGQLLASNTAGARVTQLTSLATPTSTQIISFANSWKCTWESHDGRTVHCQFPLVNPILRSWQIPRYDASRDDVKPLAELISGFTADEEGNVLMLAPDEFLNNPEPFRRAWRAWRGLASP